MYFVRVDEGEGDFYVLFRVETLVRGGNCTTSRKRIPPPRAEAARKA